MSDKDAEKLGFDFARAGGWSAEPNTALAVSAGRKQVGDNIGPWVVGFLSGISTNKAEGVKRRFSIKEMIDKLVA